MALQASDVHEPYVTTYMTPAIVSASGETLAASPIRTDESAVGGGAFTGFPAALIAFGCLVFLLALAAMAYLCFIKRRYMSYKKNLNIILKSFYF